MKKRLLSAALVLCMALNLLPMEAFAADAADDYTPPVVSQLYYISNPGTEEEQRVQILNPSSPLNIIPAKSFSFEVQFKNPEYVDKVYITSTVANVTSSLEANVDSAHSTWRTNGFFNGDSTYVPGTINVKYTTHHGVITVTNTWNTAWDALKLSGIEINDETQTEGATSFNVMLSGLEGFTDEYLSAVISESNGIDDAASEVKGWLEDLDSLVHFEFKSAEGNTDYIAYLGYPAVESQNCALIVKEVSGNKFTTMVIKKATGDLDAVADQLSAINTISSLYSDYYKISAESAELKEEIAASSTMSEQEKADANQKVNDLDNDKKLFSLFTTVLPLVAGTAAGPAGLLFSALLGSITATSDYFWDYRVGLIKGCDPIENIFTESNDHPGWTELSSGTISESGNYYLTSDRGIQISENAKVTLCLHGRNVRGITMQAGATLCIRDCKYEEHADGSVAGGVINRTITMVGQNELMLEQGIIQGNYSHAIVSEGSNAIISVKGGIIEGVNGAMIADDGGGAEITIDGGLLTYSGSMGSGIRVNNTNVTINGGTINSTNAIYPFDANGNSDATIQINGGTITGSFRTNTGRMNVNMKSGSISGNISVGTVSIQKGTCTGTVSGENVTIIDGTVGHLSGTYITVEGGIISDGATFSSGTIAVINDGIIYGSSSNGIGIDNYRNSKLTINGGTVYGGITNANTAQLIVTNGTINGGITNNNSSATTLLIKNGTNIQVSGTKAFSSTPIVKADTGYAGNVTYYNSVSAQGTPITIAEAANIDYTQPYVRLVAGGAVSSDGNITITPSAGGNISCSTTTPQEGDTVTITVTPEAGYQGGAPTVTDSDGNNVAVTNAGNGTYTFVMPAGNVTITPAEFIAISYTVTAPASMSNGTVTVNPTMAKKGDTVTITVIPEAGYQGGVPTVKDADDKAVTVTNAGNGKYTFVMPASNVTITPAAFTPISYKVTVAEKISNGTVTVSPATATAGTEVTITATPANKAYMLDTITVVDAEGGTVAVTGTKFTMPAKDVTVNAMFKLKDTPVLTYTSYEKMTAADKKTYYGGKLEIFGLTSGEQYVVTFDNGLVTNGVIPRLVTVATADTNGKITLSCQSSVNVMVFSVIGEDVNKDLVELYAKNHAGVSVKSLAPSGN